MILEIRKLRLIEEIIKIEDEAVIAEIETVITKSKLHPAGHQKLKDLVGILSDEEADEMKRTIEEGCGRVNPDDWK